MSNHLIDELQESARLLRDKALAGDPGPRARVRRLRELRALDDLSLGAALTEQHCLTVLARELGFDGWPHAKAVLSGDVVGDYGKLLYPQGFEVHWNIWFARYEHARTVRAQTGGFLLAYRRQFFVADEHFIRDLGLDPADPDWDAIGRDWAHPDDPAARARLSDRLVRARMPLV